MERTNIRVVDLMITGICNLGCPFCYGPDPNDPAALAPGQLSALIDFLAGRGIEGVVIAGGEPTLSPVLGHAVRSLTERGMWVALQTNATRPRVLADLLHLLDWVALPLDSVSDGGGLAMRTARNHHRNTMRFALSPRMRQARQNGTALKMGTVVTRENVSEVMAVGESVRNVGPDVWKLYEFRPRGAGRVNAAELALPHEEFVRVTSAVVRRFPDLNVVVSPAEASVGAYLVVNPDSTLLVPQEDAYLSFGALVSGAGIVRRDVWDSAVRALDVGRLRDNVSVSFPRQNPWANAAADPAAATRAADEDAVPGVTPRVVLDRDGR